MSPAPPKSDSIRQLYDRFEEQVYNEGNVEAIDTLIAEDFTHHAPIDTPDGRDGYKEFIRQFKAAFPDSTSETLDTIVEDDKIAVRYVNRGTHQGEFAGVPATGREVEIEGISIYRIADGRIAEEWAQPDMLGLMDQLGVTEH